MRLRKLSGLALCLMVLFVMGCGSDSDSTSGNGTETEGTDSSGGDSGSTGGNGTGDGVVDAPGDGDDGDTDDPDLGNMACHIGMTATAPGDDTNGIPESEGGTGDSGSMDVGMSDSSDDDTATTTPGDVDDPEPLVGMVEIAGADEDLADLETDAYEIAIAGDNAPAIVDDVLTVTLSRGGGCPDEEHDFTLVVAPEFREKHPVELAVTIVHDNKGDMCEAYPTDEVEFDLMKIKDLYEAAYSEDDGVVSLAFQTPDGSACDYAGLAYNMDTGSSP